MSHLALADEICADLGLGLASELELGRIEEVRSAVSAVRIRSDRFGEIWIALDRCLVAEIAAEEAANPATRPVLCVEDVARLRGKCEQAIRAVLEGARAFPGVRVIL